MKTKNMLWAALSMTAALVMTACSNDDNANESPAQQNAAKTIPYTVTVNGGEGGATTRATVADDPSDATNYHKTLYFADGDKLYVTGTNIKGVLEIQTGTGTANATFSGDLTYSGSDTPASGLSLTATLVSAQQTVGTEVSVDAVGAVTVNYPTTSYCGDVAEAVQKYSNLTGTSTYSSKSFTLTQQTAFLNFEITFADGTAENTTLETVVNNNSSAICTANVETKKDGEKVVAKFVLPVASGTVLSGATVKMGDKAALTINNATLTGKVYNVKRTQAAAATPLDNTTTAWTAGTFAVPAGGLTYSDAITVSGDVTLTLTDGETLTLNKGISLASGATLTIEGNGAMVVNGTNNSTASTVAGSTGTLILTSGTLTATGGKGEDKTDDEQTGASGGAAINGSVIVSGGTLTATGGNGGSVDYTYDSHGGNGGDAISGTLTENGGSTSVNDGSNGSIGSNCDDCTAGTGGKGHN